jgi:hypothetical protein
MAAASEYVLEPIRNGAEFTLHRAGKHGNPSAVLVVAPTAERSRLGPGGGWSTNTRAPPSLSPGGAKPCADPP